MVADAALREQQRILGGILEHTDVLIYAKDLEGRFLMSNRALENLTPSASPLIGLTDHDLFDRDTADAYRRNDTRILASREWQVFSEEVIHPDGSSHTYRSTKFPLFDDAGTVIGIGGVSTDVTELTAARAAHAAAEHRWRALIEQSPIAVTVVDAKGVIVFANAGAVQLCGATGPADMVGRTLADFLPAAEHDVARTMLRDLFDGHLELRGYRVKLKRLTNETIKVELNARVVAHRDAPTVQFEFRDVTELTRIYAQLKHSASTDPLTGVLNRRAWDERLRSILVDVDLADAALTIAVVDLDHFKAYNDAHGHDAGDALLKEFTTAASTSLRHTDVFARWGGEEFLIALPHTSVSHAGPVLERVRSGVPAGQTCSVGYTDYRRPEPLRDTLARADKALYVAKSRGRNQIACT